MNVIAANPSDVQPADVYQLVTALAAEVRWVFGVLIVLSAMVVIQVVAKVILYLRVVSVLEHVVDQQSRTERLLDLAEVHGRVTDSQKDRTVQAVKDTQRTIGEMVQQTAKIGTAAAAVAAEKLADRVVEKITQGTGTGPGSTTDADRLPVIPPGQPPARPPT